MLKIWSIVSAINLHALGQRYLLTDVKKQQKQQADNATPGGKKKKVTAAQLRVQKGV
jgi:hypothetical protein